MKRPALVTGAAGFVGRRLVGHLRAAGHPVHPIDRSHGDISGAETLTPFRDSGVATVFHLAARTFVPDAWSDPVGFLDTNLSGTARVLEFCRATGARLVFLSAFVYGQPKVLPVPETADVRCSNPYAQSKFLAEQLCAFYAETLAVPATVLRPFNVYGPGQNARFLVPSILAQVRAGGAIEVQDLEPRRDFIFVDDLIEAMVLAEQRKEVGYAVFNVGSGRSHSVAELIDVVQTEAGSALEIRSRGIKRIQEISDTVADLSKIRRELGWSPKHDLASGVKECWRAEMELP